MERISLFGLQATGKTTLARATAARSRRKDLIFTEEMAIIFWYFHDHKKYPRILSYYISRIGLRNNLIRRVFSKIVLHYASWALLRQLRASKDKKYDWCEYIMRKEIELEVCSTIDKFAHARLLERHVFIQYLCDNMVVPGTVLCDEAPINLVWSFLRYNATVEQMKEISDQIPLGDAILLVELDPYTRRKRLFQRSKRIELHEEHKQNVWNQMSEHVIFRAKIQNTRAKTLPSTLNNSEIRRSSDTLLIYLRSENETGLRKSYEEKMPSD